MARKPQGNYIKLMIKRLPSGVVVSVKNVDTVSRISVEKNRQWGKTELTED